MKAYSKIIKNKKNLKNSEVKSKGIFCLPLYPELKISELNKICSSLIKILKKIYLLIEKLTFPLCAISTKYL